MATRNLMEKREYIFDRLARLVGQLEELDTCQDANLIIAKSKRLDGFALEFESLQNQLFDTTGAKRKVVHSPEDTLLVDRFEELLDKGRSIVLQTESALRAPSGAKRAASPNFRQGLPLRPIDIPKLTENNYELFVSIFDALVHNNETLPPVAKYHYLLSALDDSAKALIANFMPISDQNYLLAREALKNHYQNIRRIAAKYAHQLLTLPQLSGNYKQDDLASLVTSAKTAVTALSALPIHSISSYLFFEMLYTKLEPRLRSGFEAKFNDPAGVPSIDELLLYLQENLQTAELNAIATGSSTVPASKPRLGPQAHTKNVRASLLTDSKSDKKSVKCVYCSGKTHSITGCNSFRSLNVEERWIFARRNHLCFRCLGNHRQSDCSSRFSCKHCSSEQHNTYLCKLSSDGGGTERALPAVGSGVALSGGPRAAALPRPIHSASQADCPTRITADLSVTPQCSSLSCSADAKASSQTVLATALVVIRDSRNQWVPVRAIIDSGSQVNIVSERMAVRLGAQMS